MTSGKENRDARGKGVQGRKDRRKGGQEKSGNGRIFTLSGDGRTGGGGRGERKWRIFTHSLTHSLTHYLSLSLSLGPPNPKPRGPQKSSNFRGILPKSRIDCDWILFSDDFLVCVPEERPKNVKKGEGEERGNQGTEESS